MRKLILVLAMVPCLAWGANTTITDNGNFIPTQCFNGKGRLSVDGSGGYDSGTLTFQFQNSAGTWMNACPTAADCQWSTGSSGAVPFDLGARGWVRFNAASVSAAGADLDVEIVCDSAFD